MREGIAHAGRWAPVSSTQQEARCGGRVAGGVLMRYIGFPVSQTEL